MSSELYVALSGQLMMEERLASIANNVANMRTAGFRGETVDFDSILSQTRTKSVAFATSGGTHIERHGGPVEPTGNALDVAIVGEGWFGVETPEGLAYTRDGRFEINEVGDLVTLSGHRVVDEGGAAIAIDLDRGMPEIGADGRITQEGVLAGVIGLYSIADAAALTRLGDSAVMSDMPAEPIVDRTANGLRQGYREGSNVNAVQAITKLIEVQRAFEYASSAVGDRHQSLQQAVRTLGAE